MMARRFLVGAVIGLVISATGVPVAQAARPGCFTFHGHWGLTEGSVPITIGHTDVYVTRCWGPHRWITRVFGHSESSVTGPGKASGWELTLHDPFYVRGATHGQYWQTNGHAQICALFHVLLCGFDENFAVNIHVYAPAYTGPRHPTMHARCVNSSCHLHFHGNYA